MIVYEQGRAAYIDDFRIDDNPYDRESDYDRWCDWHIGWINAKDKKMTENKCKYHKGDKVTVEGTVIGGNLNFDLLININGNHVYYPENQILSHTPTSIKVGDRVRIHMHSRPYEVLAVLEDRYVWLSCEVDQAPMTVDIRNVTRV